MKLCALGEKYKRFITMELSKMQGLENQNCASEPGSAVEIIFSIIENYVDPALINPAELKSPHHRFEACMFAYFLALFGVLGHAIPHPWLPFTAVGGSLLYFGARRPLWQAVIPVGILAVSDYYLTTQVYGFPFVVQGYLLTWVWYAAVIVLGALLLRSHTSVVRIASATLLASTSFFLVSNYAVWAVQPGMYPHTFNGLMTCYEAGLPFYRNDLVSTAIVAGLVFGAPMLLTQMEARKETQTTL